MPSSSSESTRARRALIEEIKEDKKSWLRHGVAALAVSVLGLGVAGSVALTGAAQHNTLDATVRLNRSHGNDSGASGGARLRQVKGSLISGRVPSNRFGGVEPPWTVGEGPHKALEACERPTRRKARLIKRGQANRNDSQLPNRRNGSCGKGCSPLSWERIQNCRWLRPDGPWSRYHTG